MTFLTAWQLKSLEFFFLKLCSNSLTFTEDLKSENIQEDRQFDRNSYQNRTFLVRKKTHKAYKTMFLFLMNFINRFPWRYEVLRKQQFCRWRRAGPQQVSRIWSDAGMSVVGRGCFLDGSFRFCKYICVICPIKHYCKTLVNMIWF